VSWRILEKWFNVAPWKDAKHITDNKGEKFWIYWNVEKFEHAAELHVWYRGRPVGMMNSLRNGDKSITLADVFIREEPRLRGRGLGKAMMREFIEWARENKFKRIWGFIKPHDGSTMEYITEWYRRQGFRVQDGQIFYELVENT
jgi:GNAT superfamily N-acetyltransferase